LNKKLFFSFEINFEEEKQKKMEREAVATANEECQCHFCQSLPPSIHQLKLTVVVAKRRRENV
jgi:hypothetical protein